MINICYIADSKKQTNNKMKKNTFYFSHDYNTTSDPKIQAFLSKFGATGYGVFWRIVEMLHEEPEHRLPLKKYIFEAVGFQLKCDPDLIIEMVAYLSDECEVFQTENEYFYSERVLENMEKRASIKEKRSFAGKKSAEKRGQISTPVEQVPTKEKKVKEIKVKKESIDWDKLLEFFNETFGKNNRVINASVKSKYLSRLKEGYTQKDIAKAMKVCKENQFHKDNNFTYCTFDYFARSKTLDQYAFSADAQIKKYTPTT